MALTYTAIATVTVGSGGASSITFSSIPATYTDLCVLASLRDSNSGDWLSDTLLQFNGSSANLSKRMIYAVSGTVYSNSTTDISIWSNGNAGDTSVFSNISIYIPNYASSNNKSVSVESTTEQNATNYAPSMLAGLWSNTAAITEVKLTPSSSPYRQYSTATLYGIKNTV